MAPRPDSGSNPNPNPHNSEHQWLFRVGSVNPPILKAAVRPEFLVYDRERIHTGHQTCLGPTAALADFQPFE
jgi:hypothetical protein